MATRVHEQMLIKSIFLANGNSILITFLHTILNGIKPVPGETISHNIANDDLVSSFKGPRSP